MISFFNRKPLLLPLLFLLAASCFGGVDKRGSVKDYHNGLVITEGGEFKIGNLPAAWKRKAFDYRAVLFTHSKINASISVDSFCKGSFDDSSLETLAGQLFYNLSNIKKNSQSKLTLNGREALLVSVSGSLDGAPVRMDAVVLKMNECVFDFAYVAIPQDYAAGLKDFEKLYKGFRYVRGPRID